MESITWFIADRAEGSPRIYVHRSA